MSYDSDRPTLPPTSRRAQRLARLKDVLSLIGTAAALLSTALGVAWAWLDHLATDAEVSDNVRAHDSSADAHARLRDRIDALEAAHQTHAVLREQLAELWRWQVGYVASDHERDPRLKAAAASHYREIYDQLIRKGMPADRAFREALRETWYDRPKIR